MPDKDGNCVEIINLLEEEDFRFSEQLDLTDKQENWINNLKNKQAKDAITKYLSSFILTAEFDKAKIFAKEAIEFLIQNSEYNFTQYKNWFNSNYSDLVSNGIVINPDNITYESPINQQPLPTFNQFLSNFPKKGSPRNYRELPTSDVYNLVGGSLLISHQNNPKAYGNACSIRGSRALLYSNISIPVLKYNGSQRTQKGSDNKNYVLDAVSFNKFMIDKFGETNNKLEGLDANDPVKVAKLLKDKNGIYIIINNSHQQAGYSGHVDAIINGLCIGGAYTGVSGGVKSIRVWELN